MSTQQGDSESADPSGTQGKPDGTQGKDVPLGPACLMVFIFFLVGLCILVAFMSFMLTGKQGGRAATALREQLIPWVDQSTLSDADQVAIIDELTSLASQMERDELTSRQLTRLGIRLSNSPILQWGIVEEVNRLAQASRGLTEQERLDFAQLCDRWLRAAGDGKFSMSEMDFAVQNMATKDPRSGRLTLKPDIDDEQLREFYRRVLSICENSKVPDEPFVKSVSQVFKSVIEDGLSER